MKVSENFSPIRKVKKYTFEVTKTLQKQVEIFAESKSEAMEILKKAYRNEHIVLDLEDCVHAEFSLVQVGKPEGFTQPVSL